MGRDPFSKKLGLKTPKALSPVQLFIILTAGGGGESQDPRWLFVFGFVFSC